MDLVIEPMDTLPCRLEVFTINGKNADQNDFGYAYELARKAIKMSNEKN